MPGSTYDKEGKLKSAKDVEKAEKADKKELEKSLKDFDEKKISDSALAGSLKEGSFSVNGKKIEISKNDSLKDVFNRIKEETGGKVKAKYDHKKDSIEFKSSKEIELGSDSDSSNFLALAKLDDDGEKKIRSESRIHDGSSSNSGTAQASGGTQQTNNTSGSQTQGSTINGDSDDLDDEQNEVAEQKNPVSTKTDDYESSRVKYKEDRDRDSDSIESHKEMLRAQIKEEEVAAAAPKAESQNFRLTGLESSLNRMSTVSISAPEGGAMSLINPSSGESPKLNLFNVNDLFDENGAPQEITDKYAPPGTAAGNALIKGKEAIAEEANKLSFDATDFEKIVESNKQLMVTKFMSVDKAKDKAEEQVNFMSKNIFASFEYALDK